MEKQLSENEIRAYKELPRLRELDSDLFCYRLMVLLVETGLMAPWEATYNGNSLFRIS